MPSFEPLNEVKPPPNSRTGCNTSIRQLGKSLMAFKIHKRVMPPRSAASSRFTFKPIKATEVAGSKVNHSPSPPSQSPDSHTATTTTHHHQHCKPNRRLQQRPQGNANMVNKGGVSVRVADLGFDDETYSHAFYKEHDIDGTSYIKVATGEQFGVIVDISPDFDFMGCPEVQIRCTIDSEDTMWSLSAAEVASLRAQNNMRRINFFETERFVDGRWMRCAMSFGELDGHNRHYWNPRIIRRHIRELSRIVVTITRGATEDWGPVMVEPHESAYDWQYTARAVVENHHITHALKTLPFEETIQPWQNWHFEPAHGVVGRPMQLEIRYRTQEALELLGIAPNAEVDVKNEPEDRKDPTIKTERAPIVPKLETEAVVKIEDGELDEQRPQVKSEASKPRRKKPSSRPVKQEPEQQQVFAVPGTKRKRKAASETTSTSKKVKREEPSADPEPEHDGPWSGTRSQARGKGKVSDAAAVSKVPATATNVVSEQQGGDADDDDEVQFLWSQPARRVVGEYVID